MLEQLLHLLNRLKILSSLFGDLKITHYLASYSALSLKVFSVLFILITPYLMYEKHYRKSLGNIMRVGFFNWDMRWMLWEKKSLSIEEYCLKIKKIADKLTCAGSPISDKDMFNKFSIVLELAICIYLLLLLLASYIMMVHMLYCLLKRQDLNKVIMKSTYSMQIVLTLLTIITMA